VLSKNQTTTRALAATSNCWGRCIDGSVVGSNTIVPTLRAAKVKQINTLIITHSDLDHLVGIVHVMRVFPIRKILLARQTKEHETPPLQLILKTAQELGIPVIVPTNQWQEVFGSARISVLSPSISETFRSANAVSIVVLLQTFSRNILFTGDIDELKIAELMNTLPNSLDVIELPHHGQWSEESQALLDFYVPRIAIQSTNITRYKNDRWIIPRDTNRFVTAVDGTITTSILENGNIEAVGVTCPLIQ